MHCHLPSLSTAVLRLGLGTCLSVCYSAIFTKTNRIYRIFSGCMKGNQKTAYISPKSQLLICSGESTLCLATLRIIEWWGALYRCGLNVDLKLRDLKCHHRYIRCSRNLGPI